MVFFGYLLGVFIYCIVGIILEKRDEENHDDIYVVILEWNLALGGLSWFITFVFDWDNVFLTLRGDFSKTVKYL